MLCRGLQKAFWHLSLCQLINLWGTVQPHSGYSGSASTQEPTQKKKRWGGSCERSSINSSSPEVPLQGWGLVPHPGIQLQPNLFHSYISATLVNFRCTSRKRNNIYDFSLLWATLICRLLPTPQDGQHTGSTDCRDLWSDCWHSSSSWRRAERKGAIHTANMSSTASPLPSWEKQDRWSHFYHKSFSQSVPPILVATSSSWKPFHICLSSLSVLALFI